MDKLSVSLISVLTVSLLHMLIPSHWLCFVVVGRAQRWSTRKTMGVAAAAGFLHVVTTVALGVAIAFFGRSFIADEETMEKANPMILIGLGLLYLVIHLLHAGHHHGKEGHAVTEKAAFAALLFSLVLSPCSAAIPLLVAASTKVTWILLIAGVLLVTTVGGMLLLVGLTSLGIEKLQFAFFDRYEKLIVGLVLCTLGALVFLIHHH
jgi:hypothetical protein